MAAIQIGGRRYLLKSTYRSYPISIILFLNERYFYWLRLCLL